MIYDTNNASYFNKIKIINHVTLMQNHRINSEEINIKNQLISF